MKDPELAAGGLDDTGPVGRRVVTIEKHQCQLTLLLLPPIVPLFVCMSSFSSGLMKSGVSTLGEMAKKEVHSNGIGCFVTYPLRRR